MRLGLVLQRIDPSRGGAETYVADLARRLSAAGHQVEVIAESWSEDALPGTVRCVAVPVRGRTRAARIWDFALRSGEVIAGRNLDCTVGFINTWQHDVLIPQGGVHAASLEHNARRFPPGWRRALYRAGKSIGPRRGLYRRIEARQYDPGRAMRYVAVSRFVRGHLERYHGVPRERIAVIPNAIDAGRIVVDRPDEARARIRGELGLGADALVGVFVAHNFRLKGLAPLLHALALRRGRPIHLLVCGRGRAGPFRRMACRLGLEGTTHFLGFAPRVQEVYHAGDFFVLPTYYDPCSLVVFEALACGLPVITTNCNGAGEVMTPGREGFVVSSPDATEELAGALEALTDDEARREMSLAAARLGRAQSFDRHVESLMALFESVAVARRAPLAGPHSAVTSAAGRG